MYLSASNLYRLFFFSFFESTVGTRIYLHVLVPRLSLVTLVLEVSISGIPVLMAKFIGDIPLVVSSNQGQNVQYSLDTLKALVYTRSSLLIFTWFGLKIFGRVKNLEGWFWGRAFWGLGDWMIYGEGVGDAGVDMLAGSIFNKMGWLGWLSVVEPMPGL